MKQTKDREKKLQKKCCYDEETVEEKKVHIQPHWNSTIEYYLKYDDCNYFAFMFSLFVFFTLLLFLLCVNTFIWAECVLQGSFFFFLLTDHIVSFE